MFSGPTSSVSSESEWATAFFPVFSVSQYARPSWKNSCNAAPNESLLFFSGVWSYLELGLQRRGYPIYRTRGVGQRQDAPQERQTLLSCLIANGCVRTRALSSCCASVAVRSELLFHRSRPRKAVSRASQDVICAA